MGAVRNRDFHIIVIFFRIVCTLLFVLICYHGILYSRFIGHLFNWSSGWLPQVWQQRGVGVGPTRLGALDRGIGQGIGSTFQRGFVGQRHGVENGWSNLLVGGFDRGKDNLSFFKIVICFANM